MTVEEFLTPAAWLEDAAGPRYVRLRQRIEDGIETGLLPKSAPLPAEREIATLTGLSRVTVRRAMQDLVDRGIIVQRQGSGSFVGDGTPKVEQSLSQLTSFTEDMERRGYDTSVEWLERGIHTPSPEEVMALALTSGEAVARIARLRRANGRPMAIERASLPVDILPNPQAVRGSLYEVLEQSGSRPVRALQRISAINLPEQEAQMLGVEPGMAGLSIVRTSYLRNRRVVEFTRSIYRGDAYDFVAELRLGTT
ncbi:GntR family transcriptional regulator [Phaeobacter gallaeciensis]|uniref:Ligand-binding UTRA domain-containing protein n=1 Tax=Phaeobacter gallaeciensis TaxID=60890 RepID=A0AAC9Z6I3_9RHOB|nr:GntR family transcriptional regulator [Phaeobacter gallaeciensis]AHD08421.1 transcriptional regulator, GntR family [Phaeobacter gallaeciensis DSM 26640]ATE91687.1 ligand-binding UTRA domain-containing protein [Phaeobacter gallaeciensis]ATE98489.1 ligand-binding UTRA domain-containing protein [Phaeobacter gallaeciensis]ATF00303.1 ligand-binding UTRA domain-containing protein [Phaeobacter gallaeciensis]ATF04735.1 ligand-binding UTRA domain-containing protein [Phaeobacter gallaeciensis]